MKLIQIKQYIWQEIVALDYKNEYWKLHYINPKEQESKSSARGPQFKVSSEGLSAEIDILIRSLIQVRTEADVA